MGMRLKASFDVSGYSTANQVILKALKKYGMIMADKGSNLYLSGAPDDRWDNTDLHALGQVSASNFEVLQMTPLYTQNTLPIARQSKRRGLFANSQIDTADGLRSEIRFERFDSKPTWRLGSRRDASGDRAGAAAAASACWD